MTPFRRAPAVALLALLFAAGCENYMWWDYRDDPYVADLARQGKQEILRAVNSSNHDQRQAALRIVAYRAGDARRRGNEAEADKLEEIIVRRYTIERENEVRACIIKLCAPMVGAGAPRTIAFLRERIAAGEYPGYAAISLATLGSKEAFVDMEPLTRHPAPEIRLQAATALTILGDQRGYEPVCRVWRGMRSPPWPDRVEGAPLAVARNNLERKAERAFGGPLN